MSFKLFIGQCAKGQGFAQKFKKSPFSVIIMWLRSYSNDPYKVKVKFEINYNH